MKEKMLILFFLILAFGMCGNGSSIEVNEPVEEDIETNVNNLEATEKAEEMSEAIIKLIENKELRFKISRKSKNYIEKYHEKENVLNNMFIEVKRLISKG